MHKRYYHLIKNQSKVKAIAHAEKDNSQVKFALLALFFAGVFYFFGSEVWSVLAGG